MASHDDLPGAIPPDPALLSLGSAATCAGAAPSATRWRDALAPGMLLAGRYRINGFIARGGMGEVHEAHDELLDVALAVKTLRLDLEGDPVRLRGLKRELLLARSITHPNVCRMYDLEVDRSTARALFFLTMELLRGETLRSRIVGRGRLPLTEALPLLRQLATALGAAHAAGIVHGDFKSANVMLVPASGGERVVVTDFGLAHGAAESRGGSAPAILDDDSFVGTPAYMSPEQLEGSRPGPGADLYALGIVLFEMVTGTLPFPGGPAVDRLERLHRDAPSPRGVVPDLDSRWEQVIVRLLRREPQERFAHPADVVRAIENDATAIACRHNLPAERDAFVGREAELAELARRIDGGSRLLALVGAGGSGKTRLARRLAWTTLERFPGGAWFCDLSEARTRDGVVGAVALGLDVPLGRVDPVVQLGHVLAGRGKALVILDNFEQVIAHAEATLGTWIGRAPDATFLATSRERLKLAGEEVIPLEPLDVPTEGVRLFEVRARAQRPDFAVTDVNRNAVREAVRLLDGLPLAIELLAARARVLEPEEMVNRLQDRFQLLTGGAGHTSRQATLRAALDWSWDLLEPWEKGALAQASVFEGGFTLEAAEEVLDLAPWPGAAPVLDVVHALVDKSLVRSAASASRRESRFSLLVSVQEYAAEKLRADGALEPATDRHGRYYGRFGSYEALDALRRHGGVKAKRALVMEVDNLVAACRRAAERQDGATAVAAYRGGWAALGDRGNAAIGIELGRLVLAVPGLTSSEHAGALANLANAARLSGRLEEGPSDSDLEAEITTHRHLGNCRVEAALLAAQGGLRVERGRTTEARAPYEAALGIARDLGDRPLEGLVLGSLGIIHTDQGRLTEARAHFDAAVAIYREVGNRESEGVTLGNLAVALIGQGLLDEARTQLEAALAILREVGSRRPQGYSLNNLASVCHAQGRTGEAREHVEAGLALAIEVGDRRAEGLGYLSLAELHVHEGSLDLARETMALSEELLRDMGDRRSLIKLLLAQAMLEHRGGERTRALSRLAEAEELVAEVGAGPASDLGRTLAELRRELGIEPD